MATTDIAGATAPPSAGARRRRRRSKNYGDDGTSQASRLAPAFSGGRRRPPVAGGPAPPAAGAWRWALRLLLPIAVAVLVVRIALKGGRLLGYWRGKTAASVSAAAAVASASTLPPSPAPALSIGAVRSDVSDSALLNVGDSSPALGGGHPPLGRLAHIEATTAVLLFTHSRADYLTRSLSSVAAVHPHRAGALPFFVSQDAQGEGDLDTYANVTAVLTAFEATAAAANITYTHWAHTSPYPADVDPSDYWFLNVVAYRKITRHYEFALRRLFGEHPSFERVIILEDDMELAPDAFDYWVATAPLLDSDPTLYCVSGWNDNGKPSLGGDPAALHRTDWFPGLGWTLTRRLYEELAPKWPKLFWDDWMRHPDQRRGRHAIRPEVSRVANFGEAGASASFDYKAHISKVVTATEGVAWAAADFAYLAPDVYATAFWARLRAATLWRYTNYLRSRTADGDVAVRFPPGNIEPVAKRVGAMSDHRHGVWRTSYGGVVVVPWGGEGRWAFLVPRNWQEVLPPDVQLQEPT